MRTAIARTVSLALAVVLPCAGMAEERRNWFDVPFDQAVAGNAGCPPPEGPLLTETEMRQPAHARIERGTTCWLQKKCEDSNAYRRDPEVQQAALAAILGDARFANASLWITTERRFVTVQGCVRSVAQRRALIERLRTTPGVERVLDQTQIGTRAPPPWAVRPAAGH